MARSWCSINLHRTYSVKKREDADARVFMKNVFLKDSSIYKASSRFDFSPIDGRRVCDRFSQFFDHLVCQLIVADPRHKSSCVAMATTAELLSDARYIDAVF